MGLKNLNTGTSSVGELAKQLDNASAERAGKYLQSLTGTVSGLVVTVINGKGKYETDPSLPAFDLNFTRESYGKAAVSDSVVTKTDRKSYLLDNRQQPTGRAEAVISALEYHNGLDILKNEITDTEFSNQLSEPDLDVFDEYPEEIFVNASELDSTTKQQFIFDAIVESVDAMDGLGNSDLALQSVTALDIAESEISSSDMATAKYVAARSGLDHTIVSDTSTLVNNVSKFNTILTSSDGLTDAVKLDPFMNSVSASSSAIGAVADSSLAMAKFANNRINYIKNNWNSTVLENGDTFTPTAVYYSEVEGAGGGAARYQYGDGDAGGSSSLGPLIAHGGDGGVDGGSDGDDGTTTDNTTSPSQLVTAVKGGANNGAGGSSDGGDGGRITALISDTSGNSITASVGSGGSGSDGSGGDGSVKVWVPPTA